MFIVKMLIMFIGCINVVSSNKVKLSEIDTLTFNRGKMTTGRRSRPIDQMVCIGPQYRCNDVGAPNVIQCENRGWDGEDIQWRCEGEMSEKYKFGRIDVVCEGYDYASDPYILVGSCGVEYMLNSTMYEEIDLNRLIPGFVILIILISMCGGGGGCYRNNDSWWGGFGTGAAIGAGYNYRPRYRSNLRSSRRYGYGGTRRR